MQSFSDPILRDIVLVGGGHSHVGVLKSFAMAPIAGVRLTLICTDMHTPYSGMLPGYVAGHYSYDDVHIDLSRLAVYANARVYRAQVNGLDLANKKVLCIGRPAVPYDFLSINIGSTPQLAQVPGATHFAVPVKPIQQFNERWLALLEQAKAHEGPMSIAVVGAGAGGVELTLAMQHRLKNELTLLGKNPAQLQFHLLTNSATILPTHNRRVQNQFAQVLKNRGVQVHLNAAVTEVAQGKVKTSAQQWLAADAVMWVTRAGGAAWLTGTGLALDGDGFIQVNDSLQSITDPTVFAAGDIATMVNRPLEKAGVFAVRQAKPLTANLRNAVSGQPLIEYRPQRSWLALISTGDQYAVGSRGAIGFWGQWVWRWKDRIDRRFMEKFSVFPAMSPGTKASAASSTKPNVLASQLTSQESLQAISAIAMRCGGCGAKVGATVLSRALGQLQPFENSAVVVGLKDPDDAAVVLVPAGKAMVHSVDFFRAFIDDPYIFGKVAANHALGDIWAMGAQAQSATAIATVPPGLEAKVEDVLYQMMTGAIEVLNEAQCALVGGHTGEGQELALGFAVNGLIDSDPKSIMRKGSMQPGDVIILTKPIGTGTLFAAHARIQAKGRWISAALNSMVKSNRLGAQCLQKYGVTACTDLTGFGLLGHLVEMTRPSGVDVQLSLSALPLLDGAQECVANGIVSSLQDSNVRLRRALRNQAEFVSHERYPLIFDPQTAGGLLASIRADQAEACVADLKKLGYESTSIIGKVLAQSEALEPVVLTD